MKGTRPGGCNTARLAPDYPTLPAHDLTEFQAETTGAALRVLKRTRRAHPRKFQVDCMTPRKRICGSSSVRPAIRYLRAELRS